MTVSGFSHSEISGSTPACGFPELIAANHVLHRLLTPRHSPCARSSLVTNLLPREAPCGFSSRHNVSASLLSLSRYAVYKVESFVYFRRTTRSPLTLDCFVQPFLRFGLNDVLKTRFRVAVCYSIFKERIRKSVDFRRRPGILSYILELRQESSSPGGA